MALPSGYRIGARPDNSHSVLAACNSAMRADQAPPGARGGVSRSGQSRAGAAVHLLSARDAPLPSSVTKHWVWAGLLAAPDKPPGDGTPGAPHGAYFPPGVQDCRRTDLPAPRTTSTSALCELFYYADYFADNSTFCCLLVL